MKNIKFICFLLFLTQVSTISIAETIVPVVVENQAINSKDNNKSLKNKIREIFFSDTKKNKKYIITAAIVLAAALGVGGYFVFRKAEDKKDAKSKDQASHDKTPSKIRNESKKWYETTIFKNLHDVPNLITKNELNKLSDTELNDLGEYFFQEDIDDENMKFYPVSKQHKKAGFDGSIKSVRQHLIQERNSRIVSKSTNETLNLSNKVELPKLIKSDKYPANLYNIEAGELKELIYSANTADPKQLISDDSNLTIGDVLPELKKQLNLRQVWKAKGNAVIYTDKAAKELKNLTEKSKIEAMSDSELNDLINISLLADPSKKLENNKLTIGEGRKELEKEANKRRRIAEEKVTSKNTENIINALVKMKESDFETEKKDIEQEVQKDKSKITCIVNFPKEVSSFIDKGKPLNLRFYHNLILEAEKIRKTK